MIGFSDANLVHLLESVGYWAVLALVAAESLGVPVPGESVLIAAATYAGTTGRLRPELVVLVAAAGAILGDNLGFWIGRTGGYRLLRRFGRYVRLDDRRLKLGQYLFRRHGGAVVFFGRFVAVLRTWAAFLAGANRMDWQPFLLWNAAGGVMWAVLYGIGGYALGKEIHRVSNQLALALGLAAVLVLVIGFVVIRQNAARLEDEAERAMPGPLADP